MRRYVRRLRFSSTAVTLLVISSEHGHPRCCDRLTAQGICMPHDFNGSAETIRPTSRVLGGGRSKKHAAPVHQLQRKAAVQHVGGALKHVAGTPRKDVLDLRRSWEQSQRIDRGQNWGCRGPPLQGRPGASSGSRLQHFPTQGLFHRPSAVTVCDRRWGRVRDTTRHVKATQRSPPTRLEEPETLFRRHASI